MKVDDIWKPHVTPVGKRHIQKKMRYKSVHHQFEVIIAALDKVSDDLIVKGILKRVSELRKPPSDESHGNPSDVLELPKIVAQHIKGDQYFMDNTPENQKIRAWFVNRAKQMYALEHELSRKQF